MTGARIHHVQVTGFEQRSGGFCHRGMGFREHAVRIAVNSSANEGEHDDFWRWRSMMDIFHRSGVFASEATTVLSTLSGSHILCLVVA
jgi:hypothetical protein